MPLIPEVKTVTHLNMIKWLARGLLCGLLCLIIIGPEIFGLDPIKQSLGNSLTSPNHDYWLGADHLGRDMLARLIKGGQLSLLLSLLSVATALLTGVVLGLIAAWYGGVMDNIIMMLSNAVLALPALLLILIFVAISPGTSWVLYLGIAITLWVEYFRFTREKTRILLAQNDIEAAMLMGFGKFHIIKRHIIPSLTPTLVTLSLFGIANAIVTIATLGFISVGIKPPTPEWGVMMAQLVPYWREAPWLVLQPAICIILVILLTNIALPSRKNQR